MDKLTIPYRVKTDTCKCCHQSLKDPALSPVREFDFYKHNFEEYTSHWRDFEEDELREVSREFLYETIDFFACSGDVRLLIEEKDVERMYAFAKQYRDELQNEKTTHPNADE